MESQVNLPESTLNDLDETVHAQDLDSNLLGEKRIKDSQTQTTIEEAQETLDEALKTLEGVSNPAFENSLTSFMEKDMKTSKKAIAITTKKVTKKTLKKTTEKATEKASKSVKKQSAVKTTEKNITGKKLSAKQQRIQYLKENVSSTQVIQEYNEATGKNDCFAEVAGKKELIYSYKGCPVSFSYYLLNQKFNRGMLFKDMGITSIIVKQQGEKKGYVLNKGDEKPSKTKRTKNLEVKVDSATFKPVKVTAYGLQKLKGLKKPGRIIADLGKKYLVEFKNKNMGVNYNLEFSKKTGKQTDGNRLHSWKLNLEEIATQSL